MPHIILEHSASIADQLDVPALLQELHIVLSQQETFNIDAIKSRAVSLPVAIAGADNDIVFAHLTLSVLAGRETTVLKNAGQQLYDVLSTRVAQRSSEILCKVSLEIREMNAELYWK